MRTPTQAAQPSESQLQPETRPTGLPESVGVEAGVPPPLGAEARGPRAHSYPEPDIRPDVQEGTRQPGVAVSSSVVAGAGTLGDVGTAQTVREQGNVLPSANPQTSVIRQEGDGYRMDQGVRGLLVEPQLIRADERSESFLFLRTEDVVDFDAEIRRHREKVDWLLERMSGERRNAAAARAGTPDCRETGQAPPPLPPHEERARQDEPAHRLVTQDTFNF